MVPQDARRQRITGAFHRAGEEPPEIGPALLISRYNSRIRVARGSTKIEKEANYTLSADRAYHNIIYIGGGIEIRDSSAKITARIVPDDPQFPLGFVDKKQIRFKLPKIYIPNIGQNSRVTVLAGGQDDHGGAGIGEFRAVLELPGEWHGGGADTSSNTSRVYDILEVN